MAPAVPDMAWRRYYATVTRFGDASMGVLGHSGYPDVTICPECSLFWPGELLPPESIARLRGTMVWSTLAGTGTWSYSPLGYKRNEMLRFNDTSKCAEPPSVVDTRDYPRMFVTTQKLWMYVDGTLASASPKALTSFFLPLDPLIPNLPTCNVPGTESLRWLTGRTSAANVEHGGGNAVHLICRDDVNPTIIKEVVYLMGGTYHFQDDGVCPDAGVPVTDVAEKMVAPHWDDPAAPTQGFWDDIGVADLKRSRVNANAVVLLDGSIVEVGGTGKNAAGVCVPRQTAEMYRPPEVFEELQGLTASQNPWLLLCTQLLVRQYHSVALLLPDGSVLTAGGTYDGEGYPAADARWRVEIYKPPYFFKTPRPSIVGIDDPVLGGGAVQPFAKSVLVTVRSRPGTGPKRLALLGSGSVTHAGDMNQRYVELKTLQETQVNSNTWDVTVQWPDDGFVAPPGWYLLTVVDDDDIPSVAKWVQITMP